MAGLWQQLEDFGPGMRPCSPASAPAPSLAPSPANREGGITVGSKVASDHRVQRAVFPEIKRRSGIAMRDPQQPDLEDFSLPDGKFAPAPTAEEVYREAQCTAEQLLDEARATAASMVEQARLARDGELEAARVEGQRAGYEAGYGDGMDASDRESAGLIATAEQIALHVSRERDSLLEASEAEIIELALSIAGRVVNAAIEVDPSLVVEVCRGAMRKAFQRDQLTVLAHPDDLDSLREAGPKLALELGGVHHLEFIEERRLTRGSLIVRTPAGEIDATFAGKTAKIADALRETALARKVTDRHAKLDAA